MTGLIAKWLRSGLGRDAKLFTCGNVLLGTGARAIGVNAPQCHCLPRNPLSLDHDHCCTVARSTTWSEGVFVCASISAVINTLKLVRTVVDFMSPLRSFPTFISP
jgi:hypothetical protein